jgi:4,5-dihydroxyphthalate decarboxylase
LANPVLTTVTRTQGNNRALKSGTVSPVTVDLEFVEVDPLVRAFRRMVRGLEFDVSEMAITTYLCAKQHGVAFTALPIFLVRGFHHGAISYNKTAGIGHPKDLEGRRVGVNRGYTVTTGVWARGILEQQYGVDLDRITWVLSGDEHVADYRPPSNVVSAPDGADLGNLLIGGDLGATIGVDVDHPDVTALIPDAEEAGYDALRSRGHYPINHLIVVRDEVLAERPGLAAELFAAFTESKEQYLADLRSGSIADPTAVDRMYRRVADITGADPLPYGLGPNRAALNELVGYAVRQHILDAPPDLDALFAAGTRTVEG